MKTLDEIKFDPSLRRQAGMTVPEGFFEQFQQRIEAEIDRQEKTAPVIGKKEEAPMPVIGQRRSLILRWSVAASVVVLLGIGFMAYRMVDAPVQVTDETLLANSFENYYENDEQDLVMDAVSDFDLYDLYCDLY